MKQSIVGTYRLGDEYCQLVLRAGTGGDFYALPEHGHVPRMKVGADHELWGDVLAATIHEAMEFCLCRIKCRLYPQEDHGNDSLGYTFVMSHPDFSDVCGRVAWFLAEAVPDLSEAWRKWKKKGKAKR